MKKGLKKIGIVIIAIIILAITLHIIGFRSLRYAQGKNSMSPTISPGDICLCVMKRKYAATDFRLGMIILFRHKGYSFFLTKRIIAREGDLIEIRGQRSFVNGQAIDESYLGTDALIKEYGDVKRLEFRRIDYLSWGTTENTAWTVANSQFGLIDVNQVVGKPLLVLWSYNKKKIGKWLQK